MDSKTSGISVKATGTVRDTPMEASMSEALSGTYRRKAGEPVLCRQFFGMNAITFPMVNIEDDGRYYVISLSIDPLYIEDGDWIVPDVDGTHFMVFNNTAFHRNYEVLDGFRSITTHSGDPANPPDGLADDPDDIQAKLGQRAK